MKVKPTSEVLEPISLSRWGKLPSFGTRPLPDFPGWWMMLGPGVIWMALAQGSGELIWWPRLVAKYGTGFLFLLIPACLLQFPLNYAIGRYTLLTGESIWQGFIRLNRWFALGLWLLMTVHFLWLGAFVTAGSTGIAALWDFPSGWDQAEKTLLWSWLTVFILFPALLLSPTAYRLIERFMLGIAVVTVVGLVISCLQPSVRAVVLDFVRGIVRPHFPPFAELPRPWEEQDATPLLTAVTFAGLGGFWMLFYSYWLREKGAGMAAHMGHITSPLTGKPEMIPLAGHLPEARAELRERWRRWRLYLCVDSFIAIVGNALTTLLTCLLAFALLYPRGLVPEGWELVVHQMQFFEVSWGSVGKVLFALMAAAFLSDTWLTTLDATSRVHTDFALTYFPKARRYHPRTWYYGIAAGLTVVTVVTMHFASPAELILVTAVLGFLGTIIFTGALLWLNYRWLPTRLPEPVRPGRAGALLLGFAWVVYLLLAGLYIWLQWLR
ncbi:MAG: Nramp family divalent metal transporter [Blastocatellia bacterium]|nr:Nramp family divalent metal transporter [Blastocatellia bacterium]MCX7752055.1 Nramp family divalent metal transporter [Blastocatellia bacterium]MDW8167161.1 Nramp family divalent metal transporter [Acidobacteriota bacterium]MDW8256486.1 Nramp family divalent metal transporter [Acidobacteriota bacterium]